MSVGIESRLSLAPEDMNVVVPGVQDAAGPQIQGMNIAKLGLSVEVLRVQNVSGEAAKTGSRLSLAAESVTAPRLGEAELRCLPEAIVE